MKKLITTLTNIWKIEDLRNRIITTLLLLLIYRIGCHVVLPGVNPDALGAKSNDSNSILDLINMFAGGSFSRSAIFALGVMPYISASIVVQLLGIAVPAFQKMQKEGESGRKKMTQITRYLTLAITLVQAVAYVKTQVPAEAKTLPEPMFTILSAIVLTAGTLFVMWLGEKITDKGIGNGTSLIIMAGIIAQLPGGIIAEWASRMSPSGGGPIPLLLEFVALFFVVIFAILVVQGIRKVPVQYAKKIVGNKQVGGVRQYIPLKVNAAGVMPIIFAQAIMFLPMALSQFFPNLQSDFLLALRDFTSVAYNVTFALLIIAFTFFYTAIMVNPQQMSEDMKKNGGFIPGIKPGFDTNTFIDNVISRITFPGAIFIALIAIMPALAGKFGVNNQFAHFFGGTSLLILVGVVLDTLQQIESHLLMRHYDGLMKTGRVKGRSTATVEGIDQSAI
ncbi:preprotein translocase subunit SecY [Sphingobacterium bambusae]|uniref:Protein translocase subunit SecY n=1 Tax=Sphingobacterium bambusae TaxID=662858 RepID=A0ABW6BF86_9SPHI|nr:preprotein translocase subunit SecY [Sphingobacterium bambusae]WPL47232.1 preprotein translocase subunit SecY [Sphingobacterium bambusae]